MATLLRKYLKIIIIVFFVSTIVTVSVFAYNILNSPIVSETIPDCNRDLHPDREFLSQKQCWWLEYEIMISGIFESIKQDCMKNYLELGFSSEEKCINNRSVLVDPIPFDMYYERLLNP